MKRILSVLLAVCLLLGALPLFAFAADSDFVIEDCVLTKYNGSGGKVVIPDGVTEIWEECFRDNDSITVVEIPDTVTSIGALAFYGCTGLTDIIVDDNNSSYSSIDGVLFNKEKTILLEYPEGKKETSYRIPDGVTMFDVRALRNKKSLTNITIPSSLRGWVNGSVQTGVFDGCDNLCEINVEPGNDVFSSKDGILFSFYSWSGRTSLDRYPPAKAGFSYAIPSNVTYIDAYAFKGCKALNSVIVPASVNKMHPWAFAGFDGLKDIYYGGTKEQWDETDCEWLDGAEERVTIHYNSHGSSDPNFTDVEPNAYYADPVAWAVGNGITNGTGGNNFSPNGNCNRDQIVTFLYRAKNKPEVTITNQFTDMPKNEEFQRAISWAVKEGVTQGVGGGKFGPGQTCTRVQAVTFMWRAAGSPEPVSTATFSDMPSYSDFRKAISWAAENNITTGAGGNKFDPEATCSRGQIVTFLYRAKNLK